jgi:hypothetical protein
MSTDFDASSDELFAEIGRAIADETLGLKPISPKKLIELGKKWFDAALDSMRSSVCSAENLAHLRATDSPAARAFVVSGVPTSLVIGRDGRILWRGHPADTTDGKDLAGRIEAALAP